jgi:hypothetical protein
MAAGGYKEFVAGEILDEDDINDFLMQGVLVFAGTAARGSAITSPVEGQFAFLKDSDQLTYHDGSDWVEFESGIGAAVISGTTGSPTITSGTVIGGTAYDIYQFNGSGSITVADEGYVDVLVIGGGGGGATAGAGAGAGGCLYLEQTFLPAATHTLTVGAGGAGGSAPASFYTVGGNNGIASQIGLFYIAPGGGGGAPRNYKYNSTDEGFGAGKNGGSGGGAAAGQTAAGSNTAGLGISGLGNNGGTSAISYGAGGGGGAGATGSNGTNTAGGNGGAGLANSITGTSVTRAGGGGGSGSLTGSNGGSGGGGTGAGTTGNGGNGTANTGSGGGGAYSSASGTLGGSGGSGIIIVRVAV